MQNYEMMILFKPLLLEDIKNTTIKKINKFVDGKKGKIREVDNLGKRILSYPIKKFDEGHYIQYDLTLEPEFVEEFETQLKLMDNVLRFLIIKK